jgi:hypothetical protein
MVITGARIIPCQKTRPAFMGLFQRDAQEGPGPQGRPIRWRGTTKKRGEREAWVTWAGTWPRVKKVPRLGCPLCLLQLVFFFFFAWKLGLFSNSETFEHYKSKKLVVLRNSWQIWHSSCL